MAHVRARNPSGARARARKSAEARAAALKQRPDILEVHGVRHGTLPFPTPPGWSTMVYAMVPYPTLPWSSVDINRLQEYQKEKVQAVRGRVVV